MSELELFPSDDESFITEVSPSQTADPETISSPAANNNIEPPSSNRGRRPSRSSPHTLRRQRLPSPPPARNSSSSSSSSSAPSHLSAHPNIPPIGKWTVKGLRQALINSDANFSHRMKKAELFNLYVTLQSSHPSVSAPIPSARTSKARRAPIARPATSTPSSLAAPGPAPAPRRRRPSASLGRAPEPVSEGPESNRQVDCGDISVTLKNNSQVTSRTLSLAEFSPSKPRSSPPDRVQWAPSVQPGEAYPSDAVSI
ncbi:hypothetical protein PO909_026460 [Leuciscus waleckii]